MTKNPVDKLIEINQQNQAILSNIEANQVVLIELEKDKRKTARYKFIWEIVKYGLWIIVIVVSFSFTQRLVSSFSSSIGRSIGSQIIPNSANSLESLLNGL